MYIYDFKFSDFSTIAYNHMMNHQNGYKVKPQFYVINFDDPRRSHRCNPIHPDFVSDISDAYESAYTIMLNLKKMWVQKQVDFFVESPIILFAAIIWYLRIYKNGKYCTFPHAIELLNRRYGDVFPILTSYPELENYLSPFMGVWQGGAMEQLAGSDCQRKDSVVTNDFTTTPLGDVRKRVYTRHQQSRRTEDSMWRQQSRPSEHLWCRTRLVQQPHRETLQ